MHTLKRCARIEIFGNNDWHLVEFRHFFGKGDTVPITHEILRVAEENPQKRPSIHVGG